MDRAPGRGAGRRPGAPLTPARPTTATTALPAARHRGHVPHQRPEPRDRGGVPALRAALPAGRRHALLPAPRGQGRAAYLRVLRATRTWRPSSGSSTCRRGASARRRSRRCARGRAREAATSGRPSRRPRRAARTCAPRTRTALAGFVERSSAAARRVGVLRACPSCSTRCSRRSGYGPMLMDGSQEGEDRWANLLELREVRRRYADLEPEDALDRLLEETALVADQDAYEERRRRGHAHHAARGQGPRVRRRVHRGLEEGVFPHSRALDDERQMEEERRLAYVGPDAGAAPAVPDPRRAARDLGEGQASVPSRFLLEIPAELMHGPRLVGADDRDLDLDLVFGARRTSRLGRRFAGGTGGGAFRQGSGRPGLRRPGERSGPNATLPPGAVYAEKARRRVRRPGLGRRARWGRAVRPR